MSEQEEQFGIGEVAARTGLEPDTLRYFERQGILPAPRRDTAGRRQYVAVDVDLIRMLVHLRETGMPWPTSRSSPAPTPKPPTRRGCGWSCSLCIAVE